MVQGKWVPMGGDLSQCIAIRQVVFQRGEDETDVLAQSVVVYNDEQTPVGTGRIFWQDGAFWLSDIGVLSQYRHQGYGDLLIRLLLYKALTHFAKEICLKPTAESAPFFSKYGFTEKETGIMSIWGGAVHLSHCNGHCETCLHDCKG